MNKEKDFESYRQKYPEFLYKAYNFADKNDEFVLSFWFEIPGLAEFRPEIRIPKKNLPFRAANSEIIDNLVFQIGLVELISYWKSTCSPKVIIECGALNPEQVAWWKKLYFYGLGELFFTNGIDAKIDDFMSIESQGEEQQVAADGRARDGYLVLIGGGKDSAVTLETLDVDTTRDYTMIINPKPVTRECAELAGFRDNHIVELHRKIDGNLLKLNDAGFINGHTPFSALLAFTSYLMVYMLGLKYAVASNESSANEANVCGEKINHQYSKSFEFEQDFRGYAEKYLGGGVGYFSFLRPLNEIQIAKIFSKLTKYHEVFKSCNVGSKGSEWFWCGKCAKCLFAFIILSPYLYREQLVQIFQKDLFEDAALLETFLELSGYGETKPFDCVGTFAEVNFAISATINNLRKLNQKLPYLLEYYAENYALVDINNPDLTKEFNDGNNLSDVQTKLLKSALEI